MDDIDQRINHLREWLATRNFDCLYLQRVSSVAWATLGAAAYVNTANSFAEASLLITLDKKYLFTNNIEAPRLEKEEQLSEQGWEFHTAPWFDANLSVQELTGGLRLAADSSFPGAADLSGEIAHLRTDLNPVEGERFRSLGRLCAQAMDSAIRSIHPGQTEFEITACLSAETQQLGVQPIVILIATDDRIFHFRHPLPTAKKLDRYAMLVLCGRRQGLVCSITRLIHFGRLPEELRRKAEAVARIDAAMIAATRPGMTLGEIFRILVDEYARSGYPDEWRLHHQGGPAGYETREYLARPDSPEKVLAGQVYAWNPSITGVKSEDTLLVGETGSQVLTAIPNWPVTKVEVGGVSMERPAILVVD